MSSQFTTFKAIIERDVRVMSHNLPDFLMRIGVNPVFLAFVFGFVMPRTGTIPADFANIILPGILGITTLAAGVQGTAIPLAWDLGTTREIQDRLLAPISLRLVMLEKIVMGMVESWVAGAFVFPVAYFIMRDNLSLELTSVGGLLLLVVLGGLAAATLGMVLGTIVEPMRFAMMFATIIIPMVFLGATYYPWASLSKIPWLQYLVLFNPLVYINEGYRAVLTPDVPHMHFGYAILGILVSTALLMAVAVKTFEKRALS